MLAILDRNMEERYTRSAGDADETSARATPTGSPFRGREEEKTREETCNARGVAREDVRQTEWNRDVRDEQDSVDFRNAMRK